MKDSLFDAAEKARVDYVERDAPLKSFVVAFRRFYDEFKNGVPSPRYETAAPCIREVEAMLPQLEENADPVGFWRAWENARARVAQYDAANGYTPNLSDVDADDDATDSVAQTAVDAVIKIAEQEPEPVEDASADVESDVATELDAAIKNGESPRSIAARLGLDVEEVKARMDAFSAQPRRPSRRR